MATLATTALTLLDWAKRLDPDGAVPEIVEILGQTNEILEDAVFLEGNLPTGHRVVVRTGLPTVYWRALNAGVPPSKLTTATVDETCGMLEAYSEVDKDLAALNGNTSAFRLSEDRAHIEGMNQEFASTLIYGNEGSEPEAFTGFAPRYNSQSAANGDNIITDAATPDSTDNSSIWLIVWGPNTAHCIYPKGSSAGLQITDKGQVTAENIDGSNGRAEIYRTHYRWDCGLTVRDWRYVVRINFDLENVIAAGTSGPVLAQLMAKALRRIPNLNMGRPVFYASRSTLELMDLQAMEKTNMAFKSVEDAQGKFITTFRGIPVKQCDAILNTESGI